MRYWTCLIIAKEGKERAFRTNKSHQITVFSPWICLVYYLNGKGEYFLPWFTVLWKQKREENNMRMKKKKRRDRYNLRWLRSIKSSLSSSLFLALFLFAPFPARCHFQSVTRGRDHFCKLESTFERKEASSLRGVRRKARRMWLNSRHQFVRWKHFKRDGTFFFLCRSCGHLGLRFRCSVAGCKLKSLRSSDRLRLSLNSRQI